MPKMETIQKIDLSRYIIRSLESIHPANPRIFGLDGVEAGPEEVVLKVASRFPDSLQAYLYICYVLRVAADMICRDVGPEPLPQLLRLQELVGP